jgi:hypothetical protein
MIYVKSFLAGVCALIACYFLFVTAGVRLLVRRPPNLPEGIGYVSGSPWVPRWLILLVVLLVFTGVCFWTFRRLRR